ncbi:MAG: nucleoside deaminase [Dermatophilaceae bacterium]|nr:nucleoside deaminase [Dermatophilaceae bacterium]
MSVSPTDLEHLRRAVALARLALERGDEPFGSVLVAGSGEVLFEDHNHVVELEATQHPEFAIARWAGAHLTAGERAAATVYTSGEHCPMCSAAHAWVGLGRIVYAASSVQLGEWRSAWGSPPSPVAALSIRDVDPDAVVDGPAPELEAEVKSLHAHFAGADPSP